jgi:hypothetical protein
MSEPEFGGFTVTYDKPIKSKPAEVEFREKIRQGQERLPVADRVQPHGYVFVIAGVVAAYDRNFDRLRAKSCNELTKLAQAAFSKFGDDSDEYEEKYDIKIDLADCEANLQGEFKVPLYKIAAVTKAAYKAFEDGDVTKLSQLEDRTAVEGGRSQDCYALDSEARYADMEIEAIYRQRQADKVARHKDVEIRREAKRKGYTPSSIQLGRVR